MLRVLLLAQALAFGQRMGPLPAAPSLPVPAAPMAVLPAPSMGRPVLTVPGGFAYLPRLQPPLALPTRPIAAAPKIVRRTRAFLKDYRQAEGVFRDLLQHVAASAEAHYYLGIIATEKSTQLEALGHFERAIGLNKSFERAYTKLVELLEESGEAQQAIELIETFLKDVNPHHREFRLRLIRL